jgi:multiple sugar transport system ATP-binding protein
MRLEVTRLQKQLATTAIYVTHDQVEAMTMADKIVVLNSGDIEQYGSPLELYERPANLFVAGFIGSPAMNLIAAKPIDGGARIGGYEVPIDRSAAGKATGDITVGVRPESWRIVGPDENGLPIKITMVEELGADAYVYGASEVDGTPEQVVVRIDARRNHAKGETMHVTTDPNHVHVFDSETGNRLSD